MNLIPYLRHQPAPSLRRAILGWLMRVANSNPLFYWYDNKAILLEHYGEDDGFDLQTVNAECWSCQGEGCFDCDYDGIHHTTRTVLRRRYVGGCLFHTPGMRWAEQELDELMARKGFRRHITKRVTHRETDARAAREAIGLIVLLTGHYRLWWRFISRCPLFEDRTPSFPPQNPGLYPQHLLACAVHFIKDKIRNLRCRYFDDIPF